MLIRGRRVPIVGAVSMDMMTVDVTAFDDVQPGDEAVLIGRQGGVLAADRRARDGGGDRHHSVRDRVPDWREDRDNT